MNSNSIPTNSGQLIGLATQMHTGVVTLGTAVGVTMVTAAQIQSALDAFIAADNLFNTARSAKAVAYDIFHTADDALTAWLGVTRNVLAARFGSRWTTGMGSGGIYRSDDGGAGADRGSAGAGAGVDGVFYRKSR